MDNSWKNFEPAPLEYFHGRLMDAFHELRIERVGKNNTVIKISGSDLSNLIAKCKLMTYKKYPKSVLTQDAVPKSKMK